MEISLSVNSGCETKKQVSLLINSKALFESGIANFHISIILRIVKEYSKKNILKIYWGLSIKFKKMFSPLFCNPGTSGLPSYFYKCYFKARKYIGFWGFQTCRTLVGKVSISENIIVCFRSWLHDIFLDQKTSVFLYSL